METGQQLIDTLERRFPIEDWASEDEAVYRDLFDAHEFRSRDRKWTYDRRTWTRPHELIRTRYSLLYDVTGGRYTKASVTCVPLFSLNGCALSASNGDAVILVDTLLVGILECLSNIVYLIWAPWSGLFRDREPKEVANTTFPIAIDKFVQICKGLKDRDGSALQLAFSSPWEELVDDPLPFRLQASAQKMLWLQFVLSHEQAHVELGHIRAAPLDIKMLDDPFDEFRTLQHQKEYDADLLGYDIFESCGDPGAQEGLRANIHRCSHDIFFFFVLFDGISNAISNADHVSMTHPPPLERLTALVNAKPSLKELQLRVRNEISILKKFTESIDRSLIEKYENK